MSNGAHAQSAAEAAQGGKPLRRFRVVVGSRTAPRHDFEAMGTSAREVSEKHEDLAELGDRFEVIPLDQPVDLTPQDLAEIDASFARRDPHLEDEYASGLDDVPTARMEREHPGRWAE